jgi:hypothetical protein
VEWAPYAAAIRTVERQRHLQVLLDAGSGEIRTDGNRDHTDTTRVFPAHEQG